MVNALTQPAPAGDFALAGLSQRSRLWLLTVACLGVLVVIASMVALNTALPDIATATSATQTQLTDLDRRQLHLDPRLPAAAGRRTG